MTEFLSGIDISNYQPTVAWADVAASGVNVCYVKATEGVTYADPTFFAHMNGARGAGLRIGAYHFYRPHDDPVAQADWFLKTAGWNADWLPPALDIEVLDGIPAADVLRGVTMWLGHVDAYTHRPSVIYVNPSFWRSLGNPQNFHAHPLWLADYAVTADVPGGWLEWTMWQYRSDGTVPGIAGNVDLNLVRAGDWMGVPTV